MEQVKMPSSNNYIIIVLGTESFWEISFVESEQADEK